MKVVYKKLYQVAEVVAEKDSTIQEYISLLGLDKLEEKAFCLSLFKGKVSLATHATGFKKNL